MTLSRLAGVLCVVAVLLVGAALASAAVSTPEETAADQVAQAAGSRRLLATLRCRTGHVYSSSAKKCVCKPGYEYFSSNKQAPCQPCKAGFYKRSAGNKSCTFCPNGWWTGIRGSTSCARCPGGLIDPFRKRCQYSCKKHKQYGDGSVIHWYKYWSVNIHTFNYKYDGAPAKRPSAAAVCDSLYKKGYAKHLVLAIITNKNDALKAAYLAEFHLKCERNPEGQTNYDWGFLAWIHKSWDTAYPSSSQCTTLFHTKGAIGDGTSNTLMTTQCHGPFPSGDLLPIICSQGCARFCQKCWDHHPSQCEVCLPGYKLKNAVCVEITTTPIG